MSEKEEEIIAEICSECLQLPRENLANPERCCFLGENAVLQSSHYYYFNSFMNCLYRIF